MSNIFERYENHTPFILMADIPPNPLDKDAVKQYQDLGLNTFILTEDDVPFTKNGVITEAYQNAIRNLGDMGLDVYIRNMYNDADYFQNPIENKQGSNYGTPYQMPARNITNEFAAFPAVKGFYMADEPYMADLEDRPGFASFDRLQTLVDWKNQYYPKLFWHINHVSCDSYDHWPHYLGYTMEDFLQNYVDRVLRRLTDGGRSLCIDYYPFADEGKIASDYLWNVWTLAKICRRYNLGVSVEKKATPGICIQCHQFVSPIGEGLKRDLSCPEEIAFQVFTGMAFGARLLEYFCYRSIPQIDMNGMLRAGTPHTYDFVKEGNRIALPMTKVVSAFDWAGAFLVSGDTHENEEAFAKVKSLELRKDVYSPDILAIHGTYDLVVSSFYQGAIRKYMKGAEQYGYFVLNYTDPTLKHNNQVDIHFKKANQALIFQDDAWKEVSIPDGRLSLTLAPGRAAFVIPQGQQG